MASSKPKTTMNKLNRERKVRERRLDKQARKNARLNSPEGSQVLDHLGNPVDTQLVDHLGNPLDHLGNRIPVEDLPPALSDDDDDDAETSSER
jgi:hypothetical protein